MKLKNLLLILSILICVSCTTEEPTRQYTTAIRNTSDKTLHILVLGDTIGRNTPAYDTLVNITLNTGEIAFKKNYQFPMFNGVNATIYYTKISFLV